MIILINGAFGVGKTTTARLLQAKITCSLLYDPEEVGIMLRNIVTSGGFEPLVDFQHIKLWPEMVVEVAHRLQQTYRCDLIVPMTLAFPEYFRTIKNGMARFEPELYHFCLTASPATIRSRLTARGDTPDGWTYQQMDRCLKAFESSEYEVFVETDHQEPEQVAEHILQRVEQYKSTG